MVFLETVPLGQQEFIRHGALVGVCLGAGHVHGGRVISSARGYRRMAYRFIVSVQRPQSAAGQQRQHESHRQQLLQPLGNAAPQEPRCDHTMPFK